MRIVIDLQGYQSRCGTSMGIGRYSQAIAQAIARNRKQHEVLLAANGAFADTIDGIYAAFAGILPVVDIHIWDSINAVAYGVSGDVHRRQTAERMREAFLASLEPDVILVTSFFEGYGDAAVTSSGILNVAIPVVAILYDLVPYIRPAHYLHEQQVADWYYEKLNYIRKSSLILAVSSSVRDDVIGHLGIEATRVVNLSGMAEPSFKPTQVDETAAKEMLGRLGLTKPFVMCVGGIERWKDIECLIYVYSLLPANLRNRHQLVIVGSISPESRELLEKGAVNCGLGNGELRLAGFVSDKEQVILRHLARVSVIPSRNEGFGLFPLEALSCEAATITLNVSCRPRNADKAAGLSQPLSDDKVVARLGEVLENEKLSRDLAEAGLARECPFSWDESGKIAVEVIEQLHARQTDSPTAGAVGRRLKLAYVSPLFPEKAKGADDGVDLIAVLGTQYDITIITSQEEMDDTAIMSNNPVQSPDWLLKNRGEFARVLYHFADSPRHSFLIGMMEELAGVVVLPDFYLGNMIAHREPAANGAEALALAILHSHGYPALVEKLSGAEPTSVISKYPANLQVLQQARGVIVPTENSADLAKTWYGPSACKDWSVIPPPRIDVHNLDACGRIYQIAIEKFYQKKKVFTQDLVGSIANIDSVTFSDLDVSEISRSISRNEFKEPQVRNLFVDVSAVCREDIKTGIQRVVNNILREIFNVVPAGYRVEPIAANFEGGEYCYARDFTLKFFGSDSCGSLPEGPIDFKSGDVFLGIDLVVTLVVRQRPFLKMLRQRGVEVHFVVYDLIPITHPHCFPAGTCGHFTAWLQCILENANKIHCISRSTALELRNWATGAVSNPRNLPQIHYFHLGADFQPHTDSGNLADDALLAEISARAAFLSVSTIEPRKNQTQILDAFELLWADGFDVNLVLVGKEGWHVEELVQRLRNHRENGKRLFWLEGIPDSLLSAVYQASDALIFASMIEGFGLALIEAAQHELPIIVRDIPIFREVAGDQAYYFKGEMAEDLAAAVKGWKILNAAGQAPQSSGMPWLTWNQSALQLIAAMDIGEAKPPPQDG